MGGTIAVLTDFGDSVYDGIMESVIAAISPSSRVIRVDGRVPRFSVLAGSYVLYASYRWLPKGSIIVVVVDPGVGTQRRALLVRTRNYTFVGPDNGVLYESATEDGIVEAYALDYGRVRAEASKRLETFQRWPLSSTFHGRDVFAPAAALVAEGVQPQALGVRVPPASLARLRIRSVERRGGAAVLRVVYVDSFGNVALSATPRDVRLATGSVLSVDGPKGKGFFRVGRTFADVRPGEGVAYVNSFNFVELAVNQGSAADLLGVKVGDQLTVRGL